MDGVGVAGLPGAAGAFLPGGVVPLDRPRAVFEAMLEGWATQQRARFLRQRSTIGPRLDLHALRHSYVTHLVEFDYPERFVQDQVGHAYASTTAIYTGVSDEYRNRLLERSLKNRYGELWEERP